MKLPRRAVPAEIPAAALAAVALLVAAGVLAIADANAVRGLDVRLDRREVSIERAVLVKVGRDGSVSVDCAPVALDAIPARLAAVLRQDPGAPVILHADPRARYESVIAVRDRLASAPAVWLPTRGDVARAIERYGSNPFETRCTRG
jgi:biopolymer transport protein ExbD